MNIQFKKGVLELCVLSVLEKKDCYGYELVSTISEYITISEGTIYPLLRRLKNEKLVSTYLQESSEGPPRKYYKITEEGIKMYNSLIIEWHDFTESIQILINKEGKNE